MSSSKEAEFDVLGLRIRSKSETEEGQVSTKDIVTLVNDRASQFRKETPGLDNGKLAILLALEFAREKLTLEQETKDSLLSLYQSSERIMHLLDEVDPSLLSSH